MKKKAKITLLGDLIPEQIKAALFEAVRREKWQQNHKI
jgi:hypothetical protein